jgi:hypothetical protein
MNPTTLINKQELYDNLADYLMPSLQPYKGTKPYIELVDAFYDYIKAKGEERDEKRQLLYHAKENFEDFCFFEDRRLNSQKKKDCGWEPI